MVNQGGISSSVLSVSFTDNCYKLLKSLASDWLRANLSVKNTDKTLDEMPPWSLFYSHFFEALIDAFIVYNFQDFIVTPYQRH